MSAGSQERGLGRTMLNATVRLFLTSHLSVIFLVASLLAGAGAILSTPREEDPQIVVPMADVFVNAPGASAEEVERLVARPLETFLWQIDGVEHVYSMSRRGGAVVTVRFHVGEDRKRSLVKLHNRVSMHLDKVPPGVTGWLVKPVEIDDVPIVTVALTSATLDGFALRRIGEEVLARLSDLDDLSRTEVVGGLRRVVRVEPDPVRLAGYGLTIEALQRAVQGADAALDAGVFSTVDRAVDVAAGPFIATVEDLRRVVVAVRGGTPVYLRDVAAVLDVGEEPSCYTRFGLGPARGDRPSTAALPAGLSLPCVTLAVAKKRGTNAVSVARLAIARVEALRGSVIPEEVQVVVTRNSGHTADLKVDELLSSLLFAIVSVVAMITIAMGWREGLVVAAAVPVSFSLALMVNWLAGFTINRVTLFALILSLGLVVDDPITNVDNIQRHLRLRKKEPLDATLAAVDEVLPPVIMSTLAIIVSFIPLFFISGMMGPYMGPMAINVPLTVTFSTVCALTFVPWLAYHLLRRRGDATPAGAPTDPTPAWVRTAYRAVVAPVLATRARSLGLLGGVALLLVFSASLGYFRLVPLKMLPFDDKTEFQLVVDLPEGTTLERTDAAVRALEDYLRTVPEVVDFQSYVGVPSPMDFNGLVRHYYLRRSPSTAEVRVNLRAKELRPGSQSHTVTLRHRDALTALARAAGANLKVVELPPGPPVLATLVAEVKPRGELPLAALEAAAAEVRRVMEAEPGVVDVDDTREASRTRLTFQIDKEKAALHGVQAEAVVATLAAALGGRTVGLLHVPGERQPLEMVVRLPEAERSGAERLLRIEVAGQAGPAVPLAELGRFVEVPEDQPLYHKDLRRVVFVQGETAGCPPATAVLDMQAKLAGNPALAEVDVEWAGEGEWHITLQVFRDLGLAFGVALLGIYVLVVVETNSFSMPLIIMGAIPLTAIGIMPGFWLMNLAVAKEVSGYLDSVFFTATGMIGMIALGGIVVRNSIVLIEFIHDAVAAGVPLRRAILESGAVRFRPIMLTAGTTALGAWPITFDPIFSGLAWSLIFGLVASTLFTMVVIPVVYNLVHGGFEGAAAQE